MKTTPNNMIIKSLSISNVRKFFMTIDSNRIMASFNLLCQKVLSSYKNRPILKLHHGPYLMAAWFSIALIISFWQFGGGLRCLSNSMKGQQLSFLFLVFISIISIRYSIAIGKKHAYFFFPYISDTGTYSPESCIFGQLVNIGSIMMLFNLYLRYRQVEMLIQVHQIDCSKLNRISMWFAAIGSLGMSIVANFQKTNMREVHFLGADMVLGGGVLYTIFQSKISYAFRGTVVKPNSYGVTNRNIILRIFISSICVILFFLIVGFGYASEKDYEGDLIWWPPQAHGYVPHVIATTCEWLIIIFISIFIITYTSEFKTVEYLGVKFKLLE